MADTIDRSTVPNRASGERKQVTALFIDLVEFSKIASVADPEDLQDGLEDYYSKVGAIIAAHDGNVTEYLGDGVVAMFGFPNADELAASKAVSAALEVIENSTDLNIAENKVEVRAGIATGDVVTRPDTPGSQLPKVTGMVTTLAERIQSSAETGTVYISETTKSVIRGSFTLTEIPNQQLKGFSDPVSLYRAEFGTSTILAATKAFAGRASETQRLNDLDEPALIFGPAGIGKTAFISNFCAKLEKMGQIQHFQSDGISANSSYHSFVDWLLHAMPNKTASMESLQKVFPNVDAEGRRYLALILGLPEGMGLMTEVSNLLLRSEIEKNIWLAISGTSPRGALVFEDLHWMDEASFGVLKHIFANIDPTKHQIILSSRTKESVRAHLTDEAITEIELRPLDIEDCSNMFSGLSEGALSEDVQKILIDRSGGIPLFLEQLVLNQKDAGKGASLPATLKDLLAERIDKSKAAKTTLQMAAVVGQRFRFDILDMALGQTGETLEHLNQSKELGLVLQHDENAWSFAHALLHESAYDSLLRKKAKLHHGTVAGVLTTHHPDIVARNPALLGEHLIIAGEIVSAVPCFLGAAKLALYQGSFADAENHIRHAIGSVDGLEDEKTKKALQITCFTELGATLMQAQGFTAPPVLEAFSTVLKLARQSDNMDGSVVPALWGSFTHAILSGDMPKAKNVNEMIWEISARSTNAVNAVELRLAALGTANAEYFYGGNFAEQFKCINEIRSLYKVTEHAALIPAYGMDIFATAQMFEPVARTIVGDIDQVKSLLNETDNHQDILGIPLMHPYAKVWGSVPMFYCGQFDQALERITEGVELATKQGAAFWQATGMLWKTIFELETAPTEELCAQMSGLIDIQLAMGSGVGISYFKACLAQATGKIDDLDKAFEISTEAVKYGQESGIRTWYPEVLRIHGDICKKQNSSDDAITYLKSSLDEAKQQNAKLWQYRTLLSMHDFGGDDHLAELSHIHNTFSQYKHMPEVQRAEMALAS